MVHDHEGEVQYHHGETVVHDGHEWVVHACYEKEVNPMNHGNRFEMVVVLYDQASL